MIYTIENGILSVSVDEVGAQLMSVKKVSDGHEYLWQGDSKYWTGRAYNLFPIIGRMYEGKYTFKGKEYTIPPHGVVRKTALTPVLEGKDSISFTYSDNEETRKVYPFAFFYKVSFRLEGNKLFVSTTVKNEKEEVLPFGVGGHPGFFVPMEEGLCFEDYFVEFEKAEDIRHCIMTDDVLFTGNTPKYPLVNNRLPLTHDLFPVDALVLMGTGGKAKIASEKGTRSVTMNYSDMKYMGLWHKPNTDAPYLCLEPWSMLPATDKGMDEFMTKEDITLLKKGEVYVNTWNVEIE